MPIPKSIKPMPEPLRTLLITAINVTGSYNEKEVLPHIEEQLTLQQYNQAKDFLDWIIRNKVTVGHGTINLRFYEFTRKKTPVSADEAYEYAMKQN